MNKNISNLIIKIEYINPTYNITKYIMEQIDKDGNTLLHQLFLGQSDLTEKLRNIFPQLPETVLDIIKALDSNLNKQNYIGDTPLHIAVTTKSSMGVKFLLDSGAKMNIQNRNWDTPLHIAVTTMPLEVVKLLLDSGAKINMKNKQEATPLHIAVTTARLEVVKLLLDSGANINSKDRDGATPLHIAVDRNSYDLIQMLVTAGDNLNMMVLSNTYHRFEMTPLQQAVMMSKVNSVKALIDSGSNFNIINIYGDNLLHLTIFCYNSIKLDAIIEIIDILLLKGVDPNLKNKKGETPLHYAAVHPNHLIIKRLVQAGSDLNALTDKGHTAYELCDSHIKKMEDICAKIEYDKTSDLEGLNLLHIYYIFSLSIRYPLYTALIYFDFLLIIIFVSSI